MESTIYTSTLILTNVYRAGKRISTLWQAYILMFMTYSPLTAPLIRY